MQSNTVTVRSIQFVVTAVQSLTARHSAENPIRVQYWQRNQAAADLLVRSRRAAVGAIHAAIHSDAKTREWISTVVIPEREVWSMEDADSQPLAVLILDGSSVDQLYVEPTCTGMGLGSRLIELAKSVDRQAFNLDIRDQHRSAEALPTPRFVMAETTDGSRNEEQAPDIRFIWIAP